MATAAGMKTNIWRQKKDVVVSGSDVMMKPMKSASDEDRSGGDSPRRGVQKHRSAQSAAFAAGPGTSFGPPKARSGGGVVKNRAAAAGERREKPMLLMTTECSERLYPKPSQSKSSSPDRVNSPANQRKSPELPPYIRATIAEQLAPVGSRPAREDTKENLFGSDKNLRLRLSAARCRENTQMTLFGEPDPLTPNHKSSSPRHLADTKNNLFGPPPEIQIRTKPRQRPDTPDILSHEIKPPSEFRENQLKTIVSRYLLRHQDTHQKLFGAPETLRKPPPRKKTSSSIFCDDQETYQEKKVKSLPLGSLIVVTRGQGDPAAAAPVVVVQPPSGPPPPLEVSQN